MGLNLPRSGLVQHQDAEDGRMSWHLCFRLGPLLILSVSQPLFDTLSRSCINHGVTFDVRHHD